MERAFKGIWIPKEIWLNDNLTLMEKVFLVEIDSLDNDKGCFASNEHFSSFFKLSKSRCSEIIKTLEKKGFIKITYIYKQGTKTIEKRIIKVFDKSNRGIRDSEGGTRKTEEGYSENTKDNNTYINNTFNNKYVCKGQDEKVKEFSKLYQSNIGVINGLIATQLIEWSDILEVELFKAAIEICTERGNLNWGYLRGIIKNWLDNNITSLGKLEAHKLQHKNKNQCKNSMSKNNNNITKLPTRYHNINQSFSKYDGDELEKMLLESQKGKFK